MSTNESELNLSVNQDISLSDLQVAMTDGISVVRTPHVGNLSPYNMALAVEGIPLQVVDSNLTNYDSTYYPESVISAAGRVLVAEGQRISSRVQADDGSGRYLDELHLEAAREVAPDTTIGTWTEYIRGREQVAGEIVTIAAREMPELFVREVQPDGSTRRVNDAASKAVNGRIMPLLDDPRGQESAPLAPNSVNIMIGFVGEALRTGRDVQYHLSGPAMADYAMKEPVNSELKRLYALVKQRASFADQLPDALSVTITDTTDFRFAVLAAQSADADDARAAMAAHAANTALIGSIKGEFFRSAAASDKEASKRVANAGRSLSQNLDHAVARRISGVRGNLTDAATSVPESIATQYDFREAGIYVPEAMRQLSFAELRTITLKMRKLVELVDE